mmetsp:Transcript_32272/g.64380  ORF Transcript_32272/g.64380 Transcript_32272/m.64380 type:complete len:299 (-) Transcript_32272:273-1169(-)
MLRGLIDGDQRVLVLCGAAHAHLGSPVGGAVLVRLRKHVWNQALVERATHADCDLILPFVVLTERELHTYTGTFLPKLPHRLHRAELIRPVVANHREASSLDWVEEARVRQPDLYDLRAHAACIWRRCRTGRRGRGRWLWFGRGSSGCGRRLGGFLSWGRRACFAAELASFLRWFARGAHALQAYHDLISLRAGLVHGRNAILLAPRVRTRVPDDRLPPLCALIKVLREDALCRVPQVHSRSVIAQRELIVHSGGACGSCLRVVLPYRDERADFIRPVSNAHEITPALGRKQPRFHRR